MSDQRNEPSASYVPLDGNTRQASFDTIAEGDRLQDYEVINCEQLALLWGLKGSWIREHVRSRSADPIPHVRFGKYVRFLRGSPALENWLKKRIVSGSNGKKGRALR